RRPPGSPLFAYTTLFRSPGSAHRSGDVPGLAAAGVQPARLALVAVIGIVIWVTPHPAGVDPRAWRLLAIFIATVVGLVTKPLPLDRKSTRLNSSHEWISY